MACYTVATKHVAPLLCVQCRIPRHDGTPIFTSVVQPLSKHLTFTETAFTSLCFRSIVMNTRSLPVHRSVHHTAVVRPRLRSAVTRCPHIACSALKHESSAFGASDPILGISRRQLLAAPFLLGSASVLTSGSAGPALAAIGPTTTSSGFESRVSEFTLPNGLHFVVLERHNAPVVSCHTHARVGAFVEEEGSSGLAHLLEHMAFKGTARIGSSNWPAEQAILQAQDEVFYELRELKSSAEASGRSSSRSARIQQLQGKLDKLKSDGEKVLVPNAFGSMLQEAGAVGLNAATSHDNTRYYVLLPANKLELWFALESERFQAPVFRELYTEKEVIGEERRARWENNPLGKFTAEYLMEALDNPYRRPVIGFAEDFDRFGSHEVAAFFNKYYHPRNLTISIVGDVDPAKVQQLAEKYFGHWTAAPGAVTLNSSIQQLAAEPMAQPMAALAATAATGVPVLPMAPGIAAVNGSALLSSSSGTAGTFKQRTAAGPLLAMGYYRPSITGRTGTAMEVAADVLSGGRSSRLIKNLVMRNACLSASCLPGYPGDLHPGLALVSAVPQSGGDLARLTSDLQQQLDALANDGPSAAELGRVKAAARAGLLSALTSNGSMAGLLAAYHTVTGSWRGVLEELDNVETLTEAEVAGVVGQVFREDNRFTGMALPL